MRISDIVAQLQLILPTKTSYFSTNVSAGNITVSNNIATINYALDFSTGDVIVIDDYKFNNVIDSYTKDGNVITFKTTYNHDLTLDYQNTVELTGTLAGTYTLLAVPDRLHFKISLTGTPGGDEILLEQKRYTGVDGRYSITKVDDNNYTFSGSFNDGTYKDGIVVKQPRIAGTANVERAIEQYTKQATTDMWMFVAPKDANLSKNSQTFSDATAQIGSQQDYYLHIVDGFTCYIVVNTTEQYSGIDALDICRHDLLLPISQSVVGIIFPSGLSCEGNFMTSLLGHRLESYNRATLIYSYDFETIYEMTAGDKADNITTTALRDANHTQVTNTQEFDAIINLDQE